MKKVSEAIEELESFHDKESNNYPKDCVVCKKNIEDSYNWFVLTDESNGKGFTVCDLNCLKKFSKRKIKNEYKLVEYSRCAAYFRCEEIDNLRGKCLRKSELSKTGDLTIYNPVNFCEPSEAGIILASCKIDKTLNEFSKESKKQYRITTWMTLLVIILTIFNLYIAIKSHYNNSGQKQIEVLKQIDKNISESKTNIINLIKNRSIR